LPPLIFSGAGISHPHVFLHHDNKLLLSCQACTEALEEEEEEENTLLSDDEMNTSLMMK
jgi:hypothetical protein